MKQIYASILLLLCFATVLFSQVTWTSRTSGTTKILMDVTYGNNLYVAVGDSGTILTSPNGITWTSRVSGTTDEIHRVKYYNSQYFAGGDISASGTNGILLKSSDGITWTNRLSTPTYSISDIAFGNNLYVTVGGGGAILTSPDAITWTSRTSGITTVIYAVTYGNNLFVVVGNIILTSPVSTAISNVASKHNYSLSGKSMQIYSLQGKLVSQKKIENVNCFDGKSALYNNLSKGMYIVRIPSSNISRRILVE